MSVQLKYSQPINEITDTDPTYLNTGTQRLLNADEIEQHMDRVRKLMLIRPANYIRQS